MSFQYWLSPPDQCIRSAAAVDAGLQQLSWNQRKAGMKEPDSFNTPEPDCPSGWRKQLHCSKSRMGSQLQTLMAEVIDRLRSRPEWSLDGSSNE